MPRMDGIEATRRIGQAGLATRVLVLTTFDLDQHVYDALQAGASGFLLKDVDRERLVDAVRTVAAGEELLAPPVLRRLVAHYVERPPAELVRPRAWRSSASASWRCCGSSAAGCPTRRSPPSS